MSHQDELQRLDGNRAPDTTARLGGEGAGAGACLTNTVLGVATCVVTAEAKEGSGLVPAESVRR